MTQLSVSDLYGRLAQPNDFLLLDVRNDKEYGVWRIEARYTPETLHIPYVVFVEDEENAVAAVPPGREIVAVCAKGGASDFVAEILRANGRPAVNLAGGMIAWGNHYVFRPVVEERDYQIYQVERVARGCLSYVLISQGQAAVIDPLRHQGRYRQFLGEKGVELALVLDTHAHADHISSGPTLAAATGATYHLHPYDAIHPFDMLPAVIPYSMLADGQTFHLGALTIQVLHMPGHTLGQVNFLVSDGRDQRYLFSGDNIFIQSFGRPDLGGQGAAWAPLVYETIFGRLRSQVAADTWLLPGHTAQYDEANEDGVYTRRIGDVWRDNRDLQFADKESFVRHTLSHLSAAPAQYVQIKRVNLGLVTPTEHEASELELGKNVCALSEV
ncbi:MAG: MBL fold metallo-hydrolase [Chloroflexota bacterium]